MPCLPFFFLFRSQLPFFLPSPQANKNTHATAGGLGDHLFLLGDLLERVCSFFEREEKKEEKKTTPLAPGHQSDTIDPGKDASRRRHGLASLPSFSSPFRASIAPILPLARSQTCYSLSTRRATASLTSPPASESAAAMSSSPTLPPTASRTMEVGSRAELPPPSPPRPPPPRDPRVICCACSGGGGGN